jgi:hypothetical protein
MKQLNRAPSAADRAVGFPNATGRSAADVRYVQASVNPDECFVVSSLTSSFHRFIDSRRSRYVVCAPRGSFDAIDTRSNWLQLGERNLYRTSV